MRRLIQFAAIILFTSGTMSHAQIFKHKEKPQKDNVEWLWQYGPPPAEGRENALVLDPRFRPFLAQYLTAPQTFWGNPKTISRSPEKSSPTITVTYPSPDASSASAHRAACSGSISASRIRWSSSRPSIGSKTTKFPANPTPNTPSGSSRTRPSLPITFPRL
jgi:hypothetical protein